MKYYFLFFTWAIISIVCRTSSCWVATRSRAWTSRAWCCQNFFTLKVDLWIWIVSIHSISDFWPIQDDTIMIKEVKINIFVIPLPRFTFLNSPRKPSSNKFRSWTKMTAFSKRTLSRTGGGGSRTSSTCWPATRSSRARSASTCSCRRIASTETDISQASRGNEGLANEKNFMWTVFQAKWGINAEWSANYIDW